VALAVAVERASIAGEWSTVALLAGELAARRTKREAAAHGRLADEPPTLDRVPETRAGSRGE
jgi:hypothetical protein